MKTTKKIVFLIITIIMTLAMSISAFAAETTYNVTIEGKSAGHTYEAYQIFKGDQAVGADGKLSQTLTNIQWGDNITVTDALYENLAKVKGTSETFTDPKTAENAAKFLSNLGDIEAKAAAKVLYAAIKGTPKAKTGTPNPVADDKFEYTLALPTGYYLIKDKDNSITPQTANAATTYILKVTEETKIETKDGIPTPKKTVSTDGEDYTKGISSQMGSKVYFKLDGSLPSNFSDFEEYVYRFVDTMNSGLEFDTTAISDVTVEFEYLPNGATNTSTIPLTADDIKKEGNVLTVAFNDLRATLTAEGVAAADASNGHIIVKYPAKLKADAAVGTANENEVYINYSNNPYDNGEGKSNTDKAYVFTYKFDGTKTASNGTTELEGAEFALYYDGSETDDGGITTQYRYWATFDATGKITGWTKDTDKTKTPTTDESKVKSAADGNFSIIGLQAGRDYYLLETKAPTDYSLLKAPIKINIADGIKVDGTNASLALNFGSTADAVAGTVDVDNGTVSGSIKNYKGSLLPTTGGIGTIIFYIIGSMLILGSGVAIVAKKRVKNN